MQYPGIAKKKNVITHHQPQESPDARTNVGTSRTHQHMVWTCRASWEGTTRYVSAYLECSQRYESQQRPPLSPNARLRLRGSVHEDKTSNTSATNAFPLSHLRDDLYFLLFSIVVLERIVVVREQEDALEAICTLAAKQETQATLRGSTSTYG